MDTTEHERSTRYTRAAGYASAAASLVVALLTIGGEKWPPLKQLLKAIFTHHWLGKSALALLVFTVLFGFLSKRPASARSASRALWVATAAALVAGAAIVVFFVAHAWGIA